MEKKKAGAESRLKSMDMADIHPYPNNPRWNDDAVGAVVESIEQCGYVAPIIVDEDGVILAGHTRYKALQKLGRESATVLVRSGMTDEQKRKYRLLDNKTHELSGWDFSLLETELAGLDFDGFDFGFPHLTVEALDLDAQEEPGEPDDDDAELAHCPKCGFTFRL